MTKYKGGRFWIASDVVTRLYAGKDPTTPINDILRDLLNLQAPEEEPASVEIQSRSKYDVSGLAVGESKMYPPGRSMNYVLQRVRKNRRNAGKQFEIKATFLGTQVTRVL